MAEQQSSMYQYIFSTREILEKRVMPLESAACRHSSFLILLCLLSQFTFSVNLPRKPQKKMVAHRVEEDYQLYNIISKLHCIIKYNTIVVLVPSRLDSGPLLCFPLATARHRTTMMKNSEQLIFRQIICWQSRSRAVVLPR